MDLFENALKGKHNKLVKKIDVDHGLWTELKSRNVLTNEQLSDCQSQVCHYWLLCKIFMYNWCIWQQCLLFRNYIYHFGMLKIKWFLFKLCDMLGIEPDLKTDVQNLSYRSQNVGPKTAYFIFRWFLRRHCNLSTNIFETEWAKN